MNPDRPEIVCEYQAIYGRTRILDAYVLYIVFAIKSKTEKKILLNWRTKVEAENNIQNKDKKEIKTKITYKIKKPTNRQ